MIRIVPVGLRKTDLIGPYDPAELRSDLVEDVSPATFVARSENGGFLFAHLQIWSEGRFSGEDPSQSPLPPLFHRTSGVFSHGRDGFGAAKGPGGRGGRDWLKIVEWERGESSSYALFIWGCRLWDRERALFCGHEALVKRAHGGGVDLLKGKKKMERKCIDEGWMVQIELTGGRENKKGWGNVMCVFVHMNNTAQLVDGHGHLTACFYSYSFIIIYKNGGGAPSFLLWPPLHVHGLLEFLRYYHSNFHSCQYFFLKNRIYIFIFSLLSRQSLAGFRWGGWGF